MTGAVPRLVVLAGPTGTGKSELSLRLAAALDGEVVSADSMQLYRGMDIGTAKVPVERRGGIPHHLLDVLDVIEPASVAAYQQRARALIAEVLARGRTPLLVGGSGLYVQAVVDEIAFPPADPEVRARIEDELAEHGVDALRARLAAADPDAAAAISSNNARRLVRALEVVTLTGRPFTATFPRPGKPRFDAAMVYLDRATDELDALVAARVDAMMAAGFADEVRGLIPRGLREGPTASRAVGYRQLLATLDDAAAHDGVVAWDEAVRQTVAATRRLVRRQRSWFRRDERYRPFDAGAAGLADEVLATVRSAPGGDPS